MKELENIANKEERARKASVIRSLFVKQRQIHPEDYLCCEYRNFDRSRSAGKVSLPSARPVLLCFNHFDSSKCVQRFTLSMVVIFFMLLSQLIKSVLSLSSCSSVQLYAAEGILNSTHKSLLIDMGFTSAESHPPNIAAQTAGYTRFQTQRLIDDPAQVCWQGPHEMAILVLFLPFMALYVGAVPFLMMESTRRFKGKPLPCKDAIGKSVYCMFFTCCKKDSSNEKIYNICDRAMWNPLCVGCCSWECCCCCCCCTSRKPGVLAVNEDKICDVVYRVGNKHCIKCKCCERPSCIFRECCCCTKRVSKDDIDSECCRCTRGTCCGRWFGKESENKYALMPAEEIKRYKRKKRQDQIRAWGPFEFLADGYKERYYFWEAIVMYRKIVMTVLWTYSLSLSDPYLALMGGFFFVLSNLGLSTTVNPFEVHAVNRIEQWGLLAIAMTFFCGLLLDDPDKASELCPSGTQKTSTTGDLSCPPRFLCYNNAGQRYRGNLLADSDQIYADSTVWTRPDGSASPCGEDDARRVTFGLDSSACKCSPPNKSGVRWGDSFETVNNLLSLGIIAVNTVWLVCFVMIFLEMAAKAYFNMVKRIPILGKCLASVAGELDNVEIAEVDEVDDRAARAAQQMLDDGWMDIVDQTTGKRMQFNPFTGEMREFLTEKERGLRNQQRETERLAEVSSSDDEEEDYTQEGVPRQTSGGNAVSEKLGEQSRVLHEMIDAAGQTGMNKDLVETKRQKRAAAIMDKKGKANKSREGRDNYVAGAAYEGMARENPGKTLNSNSMAPGAAKTGDDKRLASTANESSVADIIYEIKESDETKEAQAALKMEEMEEKEQPVNGNETRVQRYNNLNSSDNFRGQGRNNERNVEISASRDISSAPYAAGAELFRDDDLTNGGGGFEDEIMDDDLSSFDTDESMDAESSESSDATSSSDDEWSQSD